MNDSENQDEASDNATDSSEASESIVVQPAKPSFIMSLVRIVVLSTMGASLGLWGLDSYQHWQRVQQRSASHNYWEEPSQQLGVDNPPSPDTFAPMQVVPPFPAIEEFELLNADEVVDQLVEDELVLGVVLGDEVRAYPINMMTGPDREIFNDTLAGQPIAATW